MKTGTSALPPTAPATPGARRGRWARARGRIAAAACVFGLLLSASAAAEQPRVVTTFTILTDLVEQVAGDRVEVRTLAPTGAEVHEWELKPDNFRALERADLVFYNGYGLEQWMRQVRATVPDGVQVVAVAEDSGHETIPIRIGDFEGDPDPHLWMDPRAVDGYVAAIANALKELDPDHADTYAERAERYRERLAGLHEDLAEELAAIPESRRLLVTSEAAFPYFADAYGFRHDGIWGTNAEEEGSPRQIMRIIDRVREWEVPAVFWESTISDRYVRSVAAETGARVVGPLYVDSLSDPDGPAATYEAMMRHNVAKIVQALGDE